MVHASYHIAPAWPFSTALLSQGVADASKASAGDPSFYSSRVGKDVGTQWDRTRTLGPGELEGRWNHMGPTEEESNELLNQTLGSGRLKKAQPRTTHLTVSYTHLTLPTKA